MSRNARRRIRLLTYNIHGCVGRNGREDPDGILDVIRSANADLVALQEVQDRDAADRSFLRGLDHLDYAEVIYGETLRKEAGPYGNILLSKHHLSTVERIDLSHGQREPRGLIHAEGRLFRHDLKIGATHLGLRRSERSNQLRRLLTLGSEGGRERKRPTLEVLMGDMNEWSLHSPNSRKLARTFRFASNVRTFPARWPVFPLDRIFINGPVDAVRFSRVDTDLTRRVSDHRPLIADIHIQVPDKDNLPPYAQISSPA